jgi:hypothetical protein
MPLKTIQSWEQIKKNSKLIITSDGLENDVIIDELRMLKGGTRAHSLSVFNVIKKSERGIYLKPKGYRGSEFYLQFNRIRAKDFIEVK